MFPALKGIVKDSIVVSTEAVAESLRLLAISSHVIAEGAGAASLAAALTDIPENGNVVCVVSGGCIDTDVLVSILQRKPPS